MSILLAIDLATIGRTLGGIALAILILLAMVSIHEFGHYVAGKILGFKITEFSIGFGPAIFKKRSKKTGELFAVRIVPLGGYCAFDGEEYDEEERVIELEDEEGNVEKFYHIATIEYRKDTYCFFQKAEPETEEEEDEVVIFRLEGEGDDAQLMILEDEQLLDEVFAEFCHQYEEFENSDEAMQLDS